MAQEQNKNINELVKEVMHLTNRMKDNLLMKYEQLDELSVQIAEAHRNNTQLTALVQALREDNLYLTNKIESVMAENIALKQLKRNFVADLDETISILTKRRRSISSMSELPSTEHNAN